MPLARCKCLIASTKRVATTLQYKGAPTDREAVAPYRCVKVVKLYDHVSVRICSSTMNAIQVFAP